MKELIKKFNEVYRDVQDIRSVVSPLRICPLGAHIDHQDGIVTGMALDSSVNMVYAPSTDGYIQIQSMDFPDKEYFHIGQVPDMLPGFWGNYIRGAVLALRQNHVLKRGLKAIISGRLPIGGLSSSAAVTTAYLMALCDVSGIEVDETELVGYSHWVETKFIGLKNGILDQAANILSKNNHLMVMDCRSGEYKLVKKSDRMPEFEVVVVYSGITKALIGTDYNNRVDECKVAGWLLQELSSSKVTTLSEVKLRNIPDTIYRENIGSIPGRFGRRANHFYDEMERVQKGIAAWEEGDIDTFGQLMFESGESSVHQYECGCPELITIFNILKECPGVYGARFSGAGCRGCCIGLVNPEYKGAIRSMISKRYPFEHPEYKDLYRVYFCKTSDGARHQNISDME